MATSRTRREIRGMCPVKPVDNAARRPTADLLITPARRRVRPMTCVEVPSGDVTLNRKPGMP